MNSISWFLYAVDVIGQLSKFANVATGFMAMAVVISAVAFVIMKGHNEDEIASKIFKRIPKLSFILLMVALASVILPSSKTMYLIMGSEVSEEIVTSETGQRVQDAINKKLDEYLSNERE